MKEIGGYLELDQLLNKPYHMNMIELNTGRNALVYLIKAKRIKKLYIPYFLCDTVSNMLDKHSVEYEYYNINKDFMPIFNKKLFNNEYLYIVNYYGQINNEKIIALKEKYIFVILDNTQAFFQKAILGIDTIYSCRKFFGVPDGAYLSTDVIIEEELETDISMNRMKHILGRFEGQASNYFNNFKKNDESYSVLPLKKMSRLTRNILGAIDYKKVIEYRNSNFNYLHDRLETTNILNIAAPEGPFAYPYYMKNGLEVKRRLAENKIYIPTLWHNVLRNVDDNSIEYNYTANILPLPCDQRYNVDDMFVIEQNIKEYIRRNKNV